MANNRIMFFVVLLAIVIDVMGIGLIMPFLPALFLNAHSPLLQTNTSELGRQIAYGLSFTFWAVGIFFGAPFLGNISDHIGRKKVLITSLLFVMLSYALSYFSLALGSLSLFMLSRLLNGFFSSSFPIAQAIIIDHSDEKDRGRNLGWVTLAGSMGIIIGPLLSGISYEIGGATYGVKMVFLLAAGLAGLNSLSISLFLKEPAKETAAASSSHIFHLANIFSNCVFIFIEKRTRYLTVVFLALSILWAFYFQGMLILLSDKFAQGPNNLSWFFAFIGGGFFLMTIFIQPKLLKRFPLRALTIASMIILTILFGTGLLFQRLDVQWISAILACMANGLCYTVLSVMFSKTVDQDEQGKVMGGVSALSAMVWGLTSPLLGLMLHITTYLPIFTAILFALFGTFLAFNLKK